MSVLDLFIYFIYLAGYVGMTEWGWRGWEWGWGWGLIIISCWDEFWPRGRDAAGGWGLNDGIGGGVGGTFCSIYLQFITHLSQDERVIVCDCISFLSTKGPPSQNPPHIYTVAPPAVPERVVPNPSLSPTDILDSRISSHQPPPPRFLGFLAVQDRFSGFWSSRIAGRDCIRKERGGQGVQRPET